MALITDVCSDGELTVPSQVRWLEMTHLPSVASALSGFDMVSVSSTSEVVMSTGSVEVPQPF